MRREIFIVFCPAFVALTRASLYQHQSFLLQASLAELAGCNCGTSPQTILSKHPPVVHLDCWSYHSPHLRLIITLGSVYLTKHMQFQGMRQGDSTVFATRPPCIRSSATCILRQIVDLLAEARSQWLSTNVWFKQPLTKVSIALLARLRQFLRSLMCPGNDKPTKRPFAEGIQFSMSCFGLAASCAYAPLPIWFLTRLTVHLFPRTRPRRGNIGDFSTAAEEA